MQKTKQRKGGIRVSIAASLTVSQYIVYIICNVFSIFCKSFPSVFIAVEANIHTLIILFSDHTIHDVDDLYAWNLLWELKIYLTLNI